MYGTQRSEPTSMTHRLVIGERSARGEEGWAIEHETLEGDYRLQRMNRCGTMIREKSDRATGNARKIWDKG